MSLLYDDCQATHGPFVSVCGEYAHLSHVVVFCLPVQMAVGELRMLLLFQELALLRNFEAKDTALAFRINKSTTEKAEVVAAITECQGKLLAKKKVSRAVGRGREYVERRGRLHQGWALNRDVVVACVRVGGGGVAGQGCGPPEGVLGHGAPLQPAPPGPPQDVQAQDEAGQEGEEVLFDHSHGARWWW